MLWPATKITGLLFATFQMTFAIITVALISGALVERMRFQSYLVMITLWFFVVYIPLCYWVWGGGWIFQIGAKDFAGGTVVHISSGTSAITGAAFLGKRRKLEHTPHNVPFVVLGGGILWFGWTGFNGGSALGANSLATLAVTTTFLAAATAMVAWVVLEMMVDGRPTAIGAMTGAVSGLVGITPIAGFVSPIGALATGVITASCCTGAVKLAQRTKLVDDTLDCFTVHGVGGYIGAVLCGFLDTKQGILYGGGIELMGAQIIGATAGMLYSGVCTAAIFALIGSVMKLRVDDQIESAGLDKSAHAEGAYMMTVSGNEEDLQQQRQLHEQMMTFMTSPQLVPQREDPIRTLFCCAGVDDKPTAQAVQSFTTVGTSPRWQGN